jgi:hypothetical protein
MPSLELAEEFVRVKIGGSKRQVAHHGRAQTCGHDQSKNSAFDDHVQQ